MSAVDDLLAAGGLGLGLLGLRLATGGFRSWRAAGLPVEARPHALSILHGAA